MELDGELAAISTGVLDWMETIAVGYQGDPQSSKLLKDLMVLGNNTTKFRLINNVRKVGGRVWVGNNIPIQ